MNNEEIIRMAREAGCHASVITGAVCFNPDALERFAALVAANEREACAKVCEQDEFQIYETAERCAAAIRARSEK